MRSFVVVIPAPDSADLIEVFLRDDDKFIETLELQRLDESLDVGPQIGRHRNRSFDLNPAGFEHVVELSAELCVVVSHQVLQRQTHVFRHHQKVPGLQADPRGVRLHGAR